MWLKAITMVGVVFWVLQHLDINIDRFIQIATFVGLK